MKKKQTYIIGQDSPKTSKKKKPIQIDIKDKKPKKNPTNKKVANRNYESKPNQRINNAFADAFAKAGLTAKDFKKKS